MVDSYLSQEHELNGRVAKTFEVLHKYEEVPLEIFSRT